MNWRDLVVLCSTNCFKRGVSLPFFHQSLLVRTLTLKLLEDKAETGLNETRNEFFAPQTVDSCRLLQLRSSPRSKDWSHLSPCSSPRSPWQPRFVRSPLINDDVTCVMEDELLLEHHLGAEMQLLFSPRIIIWSRLNRDQWLLDKGRTLPPKSCM